MYSFLERARKSGYSFSQTLPLVLPLKPLIAKLCFQCGEPHPKWAELNLGVSICLVCAGFHRGLGVHISLVRSSLLFVHPALPHLSAHYFWI